MFQQHITRHLFLKFFCLVFSILIVTAGNFPLSAESTHQLYRAALARERQLRSKYYGSDTLRQYRNVISTYDEIAQKYPGSDFSDNALWQAAGLAIQAFERYGFQAERKVGVTLLSKLVHHYPSSPFLSRVESRLERLRPHADPVPMRAVKRKWISDLIRVTIEFDAEVSYHSEHRVRSSKLLLNFDGAEAVFPLRNATLTFDDGHAVPEIKIDRRPTQVALSMVGVESHSIYAMYNPYRLVVDLVPVGLEDIWGLRQWEPLPAGLKPVTRESPFNKNLNHRSPFETDRVTGEFLNPTNQNKFFKKSEPWLVPPLISGLTPPSPLEFSDDHLEQGNLVVDQGRGISLGRQLGLDLSRIVIDPGHGGHDPGAQAGKLIEADLVLEIAQRLEEKLTKETSFEVILTRRDDVYIPLRARTELANRVGADLFLSIHANASSDRRARGIETYYLDFATSTHAKELATRENAASGEGFHHLPELIQSIAMNDKLGESRHFARMVQQNLFNGIKGLNPDTLDLGVKQAPFLVLTEATMPSVLTEISFLTNREDAGFLATEAYRERIVEALFKSILEYKNSFKAQMQLAGEVLYR